MIKHQQGFILINVLLTISLLSLFVLSQLQSLALQMKQLNLQHQRSLLLWEMQRQMDELVLHLASADYQLTINEHLYQVQIENQGVIPCLFISTNQGQFSSQHWFIRMQSLMDSKVTLAVHYAQPAAFKPCKQKVFRDIHEGVQSWVFD